MIVDIYILNKNKDFWLEVTYDNIIGEQSCLLSTSTKGVNQSFYDSLFDTYKYDTLQDFYSSSVKYIKAATLKNPTKDELFHDVEQIVNTFHPKDYSELFL